MKLHILSAFICLISCCFCHCDSNSKCKQTKTMRKTLKDIHKRVYMAIETFEPEQFGELGELIEQLSGLIDGNSGSSSSEEKEKKLPYCRKNDGSMIGPIRLHNWGGNFDFSTQNIQYPRTVEEVQEIVRCARKLRVVASRHSFSPIADSTDTLLSTLGLRNVIGLNASIPSVTVQAGITYTDLGPFLQSVGFGIANLPALAEVSVAGAIQTGVHGSGLPNANLATHVRSVQIVLADGSIAKYGPDDEELKGIAVGLGAFGVITQVELKLEPTFNTITTIFLNMSAQTIYDRFDEIENLGYTVQLITWFTDPSAWDQIWICERTDSNSSTSVNNMQTLFGAVRAEVPISPLPFAPPTYVVEQNKTQPWYYGLVDYRFGLSGNDGNEIQSEYFVPYKYAIPAIKAMAAIQDKIKPVAYIMLIRTLKSDDLWLSEAFDNQDNTNYVAIHFSMRPNVTAVAELMPVVEEALKPFQPRPHWGKFFKMSPSQFLPLYPKLDDFKQLAEKLDPTHKFRNKFLEENVFV